MNDKVREVLEKALHEISVYGIGATSDANQKVILEDAKGILKDSWQPIETAPKDRREILTYTPAGYYVGVHVNEWSNKYDWWYKDNKIDPPTHRQPLPNPPENK